MNLLLTALLLSIMLPPAKPIYPTLDNGALTVSWQAPKDSFSILYLVKENRTVILGDSTGTTFTQTGSIDASHRVEYNDTIRIVVFNSAGNIILYYEVIVKDRIWLPWFPA